MRKISYLIVLTIILTILGLNTVFANNDNIIKISIYGEDVEFNDDLGYPFIDSNSRTQVPFRVTLEKYGAKVSWDGENNRAVAEKDGIKIEVPIGEKYIYKNGEKIENDTKALIKKGRTYLPIRVVMEAFGCEVDWNGEIRTVEIMNKNNEKPFTVHIIASEEDMKAGQFRLEYREKINSEVNRTFAWWGENDQYGLSEYDINKHIKPYVIDGKGSWSLKADENRVSFKIIGSNEIVKYGYVVTPIVNNINSSFVKEDLGIFVSRNLMDVDALFREDIMEFDIIFEVPNNMQVIAPWKKTSKTEERYTVNLQGTENEIIKGGTAVWGKFEHLKEVPYKGTTMSVFAYDCYSDEYDYKSFETFTEESFKILMDSFEGVEEEYFPPKLITGFVPKGTLYNTQLGVGMNYEGYRGAWILELTKDNKFDEFLKENRIGHGLCHWTIDDQLLQTWWPIEGIADFVVVNLPYTGTTLQEYYLDVFKEDIEFYNNVIVKNNVDLPLMIHPNYDYQYYEANYPLKFREGVKEETRFKEYDIYLSALDEYEWTYSDEKKLNGKQTKFFVYRKGAMVFYIINEIVKTHTDSKMDLYDILSVYYKRIMTEPYERRIALFEEVVQEMTGANINGFFEKYTVGTEPLPLKVIDGKIVVTEYVKE